MADIFLSYNEKDRDRARRVATGLTEAGWSVWWDRRIPAGETWRSVLEDALENMRCMIVLWTTHSIESEWVYEEASEGRRQDKLIPVMLDAVRPPAGFREIQAADLTGWDGSPNFEGWRLLLSDLENMLGRPVGSNTPTATDNTPSVTEDKNNDTADATMPGIPLQRLLTWTLLGLLPLGAIAYFALKPTSPTPPEPAQPAESSLVTARPKPVEVPTIAPPVTPPTATEPTKKSPDTPPQAVDKPLLRNPATTVTAITPTRPVASGALKRSTNARCADLLARIQLGESLSEEAQVVLQKECQP